MNRTTIVEELKQAVSTDSHETTIQEKANKLFWLLNQLNVTHSSTPEQLKGISTSDVVEMEYKGEKPILLSNVKSAYWDEIFGVGLTDTQKANYIWTLQNIYNDRVEQAYSSIVGFVESGKLDKPIQEVEKRTLSVMVTHFLFPSVEREV